MSKFVSRGTLAFIAITLLAGRSQAGAISLTGSLNPNDANDVFVFGFTLSSTSSLNIQGYGYGGSSAAPGGTNAIGTIIGSGGFDSYFSLFTGLGAGATFLMSNDDGACPPGNDAEACHDSTITIGSLSAGSYTLAVSVFDNFSFAENLGSGTLGDGFIGLGDYFDSASFSIRASNYAVDLVSNGNIQAAPIPEPATWAGMAASLGAALVLRKRRSIIKRSN
jgi:hypothetical protein